MGSQETSSQSPQKWDQELLDIKDYVFHYEICNDSIWDTARATVLDALGCAVLALQSSPECNKLVGPYLPDAAVKHGFKLPGTSFVVDPLKGAFDLATMIRYLDYNDCIGGTDWGHPSDNLGAILAVCGWLEESGITPAAGLRPPTMRTLLEAMVKAYEIQGRFQNMNSFNGLGIDHTCLVRLASTAVVSWLIGLDEEQTLAAISHVFMDGCALRVFRAGSNTIPRKGWAAGDACMRAVQLAFITRAGQPGAPSVLTMPRWGFYDAVWRGKSFQFPPEPYDTFVMETVAFKLAPVEGHTLLAAYAMLEQARRIRARGLDPFQDVVEIRVRTCRVTIVITDKPGDLHNPADRDHSLQYILSLILLKGDFPEVQDYHDDSPWATDERMISLRSKISVVEAPEFTEAYKQEKRRGHPPPPVTGITLALRDGSELEEIVLYDCPGTPTNKETLPGVESKFRRNMRHAYSESEVDHVVSIVNDDHASFSTLLNALAR